MNNNQCSLTCIDLCENNYNSPATDIKSNKKTQSVSADSPFRIHNALVYWPYFFPGYF